MRTFRACEPLLFKSQETFYKIHVSGSYDTFLGEVAFAFLGFLGEDVAFERLLVGDLTGAGHFEALLGTGICFNLRHL